MYRIFTFSEQKFSLFSQQRPMIHQKVVLLGLSLWPFSLFWLKLNLQSDTLVWIWEPTLLSQLKFWALCCLCCLRTIQTKVLIARIGVSRHKVWRAKFLIMFDPVLHIMNFYLLMNLSLLLLKLANNQT